MSRKRSEILPTGETIPPEEPRSDGVVTVFHGVSDPWKPDQNTPLSECPTSLDFNDATHRMMIFNGTGDADLNLGEDGTITLDVIHYLVHAVKCIDQQTGEESDALRTVLFTTDGHRFATTSEVVANRMMQLISLYGGARFDGPVRLKVEERKARRSKRTYHSLTFAINQE